MSVLKLKPRLEGSQGIPAWHDAIALQRGIEFASKGRSMSQLAVPLDILRKVQKVRVKAAFNATLEIELDEAEGEILWGMVENLPPEAFWRGPHPPLLTIREFLDEVEEALDVA